MRRGLPPVQTVVVLACLATGPALAQDTELVTGASPYADMAGLAEGKHAEAMAQWRDELGLSPEQQAVMGEIFMDYGTRLRPLFERGAATAWSIMNVAPKDPDYSLDTERAAQAAAETAAEIVRLLSEMRSAINSIMTAEQIATLERLIEERRQAIEQAKQQVPEPG